VAEGPIGEQEIANREHIAPQKTGDNIAAKRVAQYGFDGTNWQRIPMRFVKNAFDYVSLAQASTTDTYTFYQGGSGGTLVNTVTITYTDSSKNTLSNVALT